MNSEQLTGLKLNRTDWIGIILCAVLGISITEAVGQQVHPVMEFWPAFGIKVAVGSLATMLLLSVWLTLRKPTRAQK